MRLPRPMLKVERQSLTDQIVQQLRARIIEGQISEGMPLRQEKLAAELGVSRVPLREAIRQLEAEGLVTTELHKGTVVSCLSLAEIEELFEIRMQLETWLFALAIPRLTKADLAKAERITAEAAAGESDPAGWGEMNWRFHSVLYAPSNRTQALRLLKTVHDNASRYVNLQLTAASGAVDRELADHRRILALARKGDVAGGVEALRKHISRVARSLIMFIGPQRRRPQSAA